MISRCLQYKFDWTFGILYYTDYLTAQRTAFCFSQYRYNNPLVDSELDILDTITPSGV